MAPAIQSPRQQSQHPIQQSPQKGAAQQSHAFSATSPQQQDPAGDDEDDIIWD